MLLCVVTLPALSVYGQELRSSDNRRSERRLWKWSVAALVAATAADAATSMNNSEANPLLRSSNRRFGARGLLLKSGLAAGTVTFEFHFAKRTNGYKRFAILNFIQAGAFSAIAAHNAHVGNR